MTRNDDRDFNNTIMSLKYDLVYYNNCIENIADWFAKNAQV